MFQTPESIFFSVPIFKPNMVFEEAVDMHGISWKHLSRMFMDLYDNPRYQGGRDAYPRPYSAADSLLPDRHAARTCPYSGRRSATPQGPTDPPVGISIEETIHVFQSLQGSVLTALTAVQAHSVSNMVRSRNPTTKDELVRAAYERIVMRVCVVLAFVAARDKDPSHVCMPLESDVVRYVLMFPMLCFGPFLPWILAGDSRALVLLWHIYHVASRLLPMERYWWAQKRICVMQNLLLQELRFRGLEVCLRRKDVVA
jgi:hypothetical protein